MSGVTFCSLLINWYFMIDLVVTHADQGLQGEGRLGGKQLHTSDASQGGGAERRRGRGTATAAVAAAAAGGGGGGGGGAGGGARGKGAEFERLVEADGHHQAEVQTVSTQ